MGKEKAWQKKLDECIRSVADITQRFRFTEDELKSLLDIEKRYLVCIPEYYLDLIDPDDSKDPIRKMCIPDVLWSFHPAVQRTPQGRGITLLCRVCSTNTLRPRSFFPQTSVRCIAGTVSESVLSVIPHRKLQKGFLKWLLM